MKFSNQNIRAMQAAPLVNPEPPTFTPRQRGWGYFMAALGAVLFSLKAIFIKLAYQPTGGLVENQLDVITLMALRMGFSIPVYFIIGFWVVRQRRRQGKPLPKLGTLLKAGSIGLIGYYICPYLDFAGLKLITAQLERLLLFTYPAFVLILGALFFGLRISLWGVMSIIIAYLGIAVVFVGGDIAVGENVPLGSIFVLICAFFFALYQLLAKSRIDVVGGALFTCVAMTIAATAVLAHFLVTNATAGTLATALDLPPRIYMLGFSIALFSTILPSFLINIALGRIGAQAVAMFGMLSPLATIFFAIIWLGEPFGPLDALGTGLTIFGIGLYTWIDKRSKAKFA
ncbi:MAG: DMT family transporter [Acidimicrobiales bacterium]|nr:DMT family transporter [Hyphomonadaceae bacterium]RZV41727.1 MAG: DMT family transporter [Acidimicrobiales bacterium]